MPFQFMDHPTSHVELLYYSESSGAVRSVTAVRLAAKQILVVLLLVNNLRIEDRMRTVS